MPEISIVLVEPLYEGNIGFAARVMKNFGFADLVLINPPPIGDEAIARASHARDVLDNARICTFDDVVGDAGLLVATTGEVSKTICTSMRMPYFSPDELAGMVRDVEGRIAILFGRENWGLSNDEIRQCDIICTIPTSAAYPIVNISHAVGILCYELAGLSRGSWRIASRTELDSLLSHIDTFLDRIDHPDFKRENTMVMMRRIFSRTLLTPREVSTLHGLLRRTEWHLAGGDETQKK
ncbi:MAG: RNA methyltransferase [Methanomicrobiales archaeon]|nr:RNA methyltransferase [Methanomicrobiales archaeon]